MRGEPNKKWNKRVTRPCPMCGGRVIVAHRNQSWWIRCDDDPFHIKYKPYEDPYSAIRAFNAQTNYDRIISKSPEEMAEWLAEVLFHCSNTICDQRCPMYECCCDQPSDNIEDWLRQEAKA